MHLLFIVEAVIVIGVKVGDDSAAFELSKMSDAVFPI